MQPNISLEIGNTNTSILSCPPEVLAEIDDKLRYPTETAIAIERGFVPPESVNGWDGWIRYLRTPKTRPAYFPTGLLYLVEEICAHRGLQIRTSDARIRPEPGFPEHPYAPALVGTQRAATSNFKLRDYQEEAIAKALEMGQGVLDMVPRSGKTATMAVITGKLGLPTVWLAPTDRIVRQTVGVLQDMYGESYATHLIGGKNAKEASNTRIVVCTAATAHRLPQEFYDSREVMVCDEFHRSAAKSYKEIFGKCDHIFFRYGMTGTHFRSGDDGMAMHALISKTIYRITSDDLLNRGYLVPVNIAFLPVNSPRLQNMPVNTFNGGHGKYGIHEHGPRNQLAALATACLYQEGRNILVLVGTKKQGYLLKDLISAYLPPTSTQAQFDSVEFISTDTSRSIQTKIIDSFTETNVVKVLIGTSLLGEGVDLPTADALVYARGEKAEVSLTQNFYRVCTYVEGKSTALIVDFSDRHNKHLFKHSMERLKVYHSEPIANVTVLQDTDQFIGWLKAKGETNEEEVIKQT